jgi:Mg2+-importing ATPase
MELDLPNYWSKSIEECLKLLESSKNGLSQRQVLEIQSRLQKTNNGKSNLRKDFELFIFQFKSPLIWMLIGAVIISAFLGDISDVTIILFIIFSSGVLSFFQERNANKVVEKLQSYISLKSKVVRDGKEFEINSSEIIQGDVILLNAGNIVPADCLIIESNQLNANESSLTGESFPVTKERKLLAKDTELLDRVNSLWRGTSIISGTAKALVIYTHENTLFGKIVKNIDQQSETSFELGIKKFGIFLLKITLILSFFILLVNILGQKSLLESALFSLALAVGMAPELLPAITTLAMSAGAKRLLEKKVIVKKLTSIQNLGELDLLCTDKTGTITSGNIRVSNFIDVVGEDSDLLKKYAYWNASLQSGYNNSIDKAIVAIGNSWTEQIRKLGELPYDFSRKRLSILMNDGSKTIILSKGSFNTIISICTEVMVNNKIEKIDPYLDKIKQLYNKKGEEGFRVIALGYKEFEKETIKLADESKMIFLGMLLLEDPIKEGIWDTINDLKDLSVKLKIITGDNKNVARATASKIGFVNPMILTGKELIESKEIDLLTILESTHIFAEVEPQQKEKIIEILKKHHTVAYIGDGINDVSALNAADVGISVENAEDVAREAADFVLMEKNLNVIVTGIKEGRKTFANTLKYIFINTGSTFGNMFSVAAASLMLPFLPMLPKQILLTNFITDLPYLSVSSDNVDEEQLKKPGKWDLKFIRIYMVIFGIHSSIFDLILFISLYYLLKTNEKVFQTSWFIESILTELFILFIIRTHKNFFKSQPGKFLFIWSILGLFLTISLPYLPIAKELGLEILPWKAGLAIILIVIFYILTADLLKVWFFKHYSNK